MEMKLNKEAIEKLKKEHGRVFEIVVELPNKENRESPETTSFYFKQPDRQIIDATNKAAQRSEIKAAEVMINNCLLKGDKSLLKEIGVFMAVSEQLERILDKKKSYTVEL